MTDAATHRVFNQVPDLVHYNLFGSDPIVRAALDGRYEGPGYAENPWVDLHRYAERPWRTLVEEWHAHNTILVPLLRNVPDARLSAPCAVGGGAPVPLWFLVDEYVLHMQHHLDQVLRRPVVTKYPREAAAPRA